MSFSKADYERFCENIETINSVYEEVLDSKRELYGWASKEIKAIFRKHMGLLPVNTHFANDGRFIEVTYNLSDFQDKQLPLTRELVEDLHMQVQIKIQDSSRLVFVLLPNVGGES